MRRVSVFVAAAAAASIAVWAPAGEVTPPLSPDRPQDRAILRYLESAEAGTASAADLTELGALLAATDRLEHAEQWLRKAVKADRHSFDARYRLGLVQQQRGRCGDAARSFARALEERPDEPYARFMLALAEERCGNAHQAVAQYARAYAALPALADPAHNPLVLDSKVQTAARLTYYRELVRTGTFPVTAVDAEAVKAMMSALPPPTPAPAAPAAPVPVPETIPVPKPTPKPPQS